MYYRVDPLSRRSLLLHLPTPTDQYKTFLLSSTRSALAREEGVEMRALNGGEGGVIRLREIEITAGVSKLAASLC